LLFVVVDCLFCYLFVKRPKYFVFLFSGVLIQQYYSHGSCLLKLWLNENKVDWISVAVLLYFAAAFIFLVLDYRAKEKL